MRKQKVGKTFTHFVRDYVFFPRFYGAESHTKDTNCKGELQNQQLKLPKVDSNYDIPKLRRLLYLINGYFLPLIHRGFYRLARNFSPFWRHF